MKFSFEPCEKIRQFKCSDLIGKIATIRCEHLSDDKKSQYIQARIKGLEDYGVYSVSGWVSTIGKKDTEVKKEVKGACLMEAKNGGRSDCSEYSSYQDFFNKNKKKKVQEYWKSGLLGRMARCGGDADQASLVLRFKDFSIDDNTWSMVAPEEWYSELHQFEFPRGFYISSEESIKFFMDKPHDDIFGERYFPVVVFPKDTEVDVRAVVYKAKSRSKPIVTKEYIVFGTRCTSYEYPEVIVETYSVGGKVAKALEWDWD